MSEDDEIEARILGRLSSDVWKNQNQDVDARTRSSNVRRRRRRKQSPTASALHESHANSELEEIQNSKRRSEDDVLKHLLVQARPSKKSSRERADLQSGITSEVNVPDSELFNPRANRSKKRSEDRENVEEHGDVYQFVDRHRREIGRFGSTALHRRERKLYETNERVRLGCRRPKNEKMPLDVLIRKRKYQKARELKKKKSDRETGMLVQSKRK